MPVSRNQKLYYTPEQYAAAQANNNALEYALQTGYRLIRQGSYYTLPEHNSMVFDSKGNWWRNSTGMKGKAIEFIMYYEGKTFPEAVLTLASSPRTEDLEKRLSSPGSVQQIATDSKIKGTFKLPPHAANMRRLFAYLCKTRCLGRCVIKLMIQQGLLYESIFPQADGREVHNACFVSYAPDGKPCSAFERSMTSSGTPFKRESPFGDKSYGWLFQGVRPQKLYVFEAAIDAASYVEYHWENDPLFQSDFLALGGLSFTPVQKYLARNQNTREVILCLDNDSAGKNATLRFTHRLQAEYPDIAITICFCTAGKDWNEALCLKKASEEELINTNTTIKEK